MRLNVSRTKIPIHVLKIKTAHLALRAKNGLRHFCEAMISFNSAVHPVAAHLAKITLPGPICIRIKRWLERRIETAAECQSRISGEAIAQICT